jgi:uncharacterized membrane protein YgaE (UPF0421/DUF939 family)
MPTTTEAPKTTTIEAFFVSGKAALSGVLAVLCFDLLHLQGAMWAAISAVIVTQPSLHPSVRASLLRVAANLIGACVGAILASLFGHTLYALAAGVMITGLTCHFTHLDDALRPAFAAVVILMLNPANTWFDSLERIYAVIIGCLISLLVGYLCDKSTHYLSIGPKPTTPHAASE